MFGLIVGLLAGIFGLFGLAMGLLIPLCPFVLLALGVWLLIRPPNRQPTVR